jgi:hypothetical protein
VRIIIAHTSTNTAAPLVASMKRPDSDIFFD